MPPHQLKAHTLQAGGAVHAGADPPARAARTAAAAATATSLLLLLLLLLNNVAAVGAVNQPVREHRRRHDGAGSFVRHAVRAAGDRAAHHAVVVRGGVASERDLGVR